MVVNYSMEEFYEDYQKIYDKTVEMQTEVEEKEIVVDELSKIINPNRNGNRIR